MLSIERTVVVHDIVRTGDFDAYISYAVCLVTLTQSQLGDHLFWSHQKTIAVCDTKERALEWAQQYAPCIGIYFSVPDFDPSHLEQK